VSGDFPGRRKKPDALAAGGPLARAEQEQTSLRRLRHPSRRGNGSVLWVCAWA